MSFFFFSPFFIAALFAAALVPLSIRLAVPLGAIDLPDGHRKRHLRPTPRLAGLALFFAVLLALLPYSSSPSTAVLKAVLAGGALITALGVSDDIFSLSPILKLLSQIFAALLPVFFGLYPRTLSIGALSFTLSPALSIPLTVFWILTLTNALNMIDGLNGLAASQILFSAFSLSLLFQESAILALAGAAFGFLPYNRRCARSFLGDGGSLFFGYALSVFALGLGNGDFSLFAPLLFFVPLCDLFFVSLSRIAKGKNPLLADDSHLHHQLRKRGFSSSAAVLFLLCVSLGALSAFLLLSSSLPMPLSLFSLLLLALPLCALML